MNQVDETTEIIKRAVHDKIFDEVRRKIPKRHEPMDTTGQTK